MLTCEEIPVSLLFHTASDEKLGEAWEQALKFGLQLRLSFTLTSLST